MDRCGKKKQSTNVADPDPGSNPVPDTCTSPYSCHVKHLSFQTTGSGTLVPTLSTLVP